MLRFLCFSVLFVVLESRGMKPSRKTVQQWTSTEKTSHDIFALTNQANLLLTRNSSAVPLADERRRLARGSKDSKSKQRAELYENPQAFDPDGYFTTPKVFNGSLLVHNPLYPVTGESYGAYAVMLLALIVFAVGAVANLAVTCSVWHNHFLQSTRNCVLASMALWDLAVIFYCLPVVVFHELTKRRLMGDLSCRVVPFVEVVSLAVSTFSLCALSVDRFHTLTISSSSSSSSSSSKPPESFGSILSKLSVIWFGSLLLSAPELLIWRLETGVSRVSRLPLDSCVRLPPSSPRFSDSVHSLVVTYHDSRMWWTFGCFFCLPLLFSFSCQLLTSQLSTGSSSSPSSSSQKLVMMLTVVYGIFNLPEHAWNVGLTYAGLQVDGATLATLALVGQFLMFARASATPVLILSSCRTLGQSFMDCCCCCCEDCLPKRPPSPSASSSPPSSSSSSSSCSVLEEKRKKLQAELDQRMRANAAELAVGTPC